MVETGAIGIWSGGLRQVDAGEAAEAAAELEELGYGTIWMPAGGPDGLEERLRALLAATARTTMATGIVNIWTHEAQATASMSARLADGFPGRFLLGLGVSHAQQLEPIGIDYRRPYSTMVRYLDELDAAPRPVPREDRVLAALAPRMLELARERTLGSHQYLVTPEHTRRAREALGPAALLAPEQTVILDEDADRARAAARAWLAMYLQFPNYVDNLVRGGLDPSEALNGGSDRLVDQAVAWGNVEAIKAKVDEHRAAGADHVAIQVIPAAPTELPRDAWRELAVALR